MQSTFETIESEALKLSVTERAKLAEHLIASLDEDSEIEEEWEIEIGRRIAEIEAGTAKLIPSSEVIANARAALKRK